MPNVEWLLRESLDSATLRVGDNTCIENEYWRATIERLEIGPTMRVFLVAGEVRRPFVLEPATDEDGPWMASNFSVAGHAEITLPDGPRARIAPNRALLYRSIETRASYAIAGGQSLRIPGVRIHRDRVTRLFDGRVPAQLAKLIEPEVDASRLLAVRGTRRLRALADLLFAPGLNGPLRVLAIEGAVLQLLAYVAAASDSVPVPPRRVALSSADRAAIARARERLLADMRAPPSLGELAAEAQLSEKRLSDGFRAVFGTSVYETLRNERLEHARLALESDGATLKGIAYRVGYNHVTNFISAFTARYGIPPARYARGRRLA